METDVMASRDAARWRLRRKMAGAILFAVLVSCTLAFLALRQTGHVLETHAKMARAHELRLEFENLLFNLANAESARRGFVLTGEPEFLADFNKCREAVEADIAQMAAMEGPAPGSSSPRLRMLIERRLELLATSVTLRESDPSQHEAQMTFTEKGQAAWEKIQKMVRSAEEDEIEKLEAAARQLRKRAARMKALILSGTLLGLGVMLVATWVINRDLRELKDASLSLKRAHSELEDKVAARTARLVEANASLKDLMEERQRLEREVLTLGDRERQRIGQDLHDGLCQYLTGVAFAVEGLAHELSGDHSASAAQARKIAGFINTAIGQAKSIARGLSPVPVSANGLESALKTLAAETEQFSNARCEFHASSDFSPASGTISARDNRAATHLYRIVQEAVQNALKHGRASHIRIHQISRDQCLTVEVRDDGLGFDPGNGSEGMGLKIMKSRASMIGASVEVESKPGAGTAVCCKFPLSERRTGDARG